MISLKPRGPPGWSKETIEGYVEQVVAWDIENAAEAPYAKYRQVMEVLKKKEGINEFVVTIKGKLPKKIPAAIEDFLKSIWEPDKRTRMVFGWKNKYFSFFLTFTFCS